MPLLRRAFRVIRYYPRPAAWYGAWVGLTVAAVALHQVCWLGDGAAQGLWGTWVDGLRPVANGVHLMATPGWVVTGRIPGVGDSASGLAAGLAFGVSFAGYLAALVVALAIRRKLLHRELLGSRIEPSSRNWSTGVRGDEHGPTVGVHVLTRRRFLVDAPCSAAAIGGVGILSKSSLLDPWDLTLVRYVVPIRGLAPAFDGLRLVQLSDTHLGPRIPASFVRSAVELARGLAPDVFLLTGDYIHNGRRYIEQAADLFRPLVESGAPVVGVLGNHDWYGDGPAMAAALGDRGISLLDNRRAFVDSARRLNHEPSREALCLAGLGDLLADRVDPAAALGGVDPAIPRVVLSHNPDAAELGSLTGVDRPRVDLMLSGHTHGGQVRLPLLGSPIVPSRFGQKYAGGLVRGPAFRVIVSRGIGMSVLPVRFGVPPEVVEVTLVRG